MKPMKYTHGEELSSCFVGQRHDVSYGAVVSRDAADSLTVLEHRHELQEVFDEHFGVKIQQKNPFLSHAQQSKLTEEGVIKLGTFVESDDVLISAIRPVASKSGWYTDASTEVGEHWVGDEVIESSFQRHKKKQDGLKVEATVQLTIERRLEVGDRIVIGKTETTVVEIRDAGLLDDALIANTRVKNAVLGSSNRPLKCLLDMLLGDDSNHEKRLNWGAQDRVIADDNVSIGEVVVPDSMFEELKLHSSDPVLISTPDGEPGFIAKLPRRSGDVIGLHPETIRCFSDDLESIGTVFLHRVLTDSGLKEAHQLLKQMPRPQHVPSTDPPEWFELEDQRQSTEAFVEAVVTGRATRFDSRVGLLIGGSGGNQFDDRESAALRNAFGNREEKPLNT